MQRWTKAAGLIAVLTWGLSHRAMAQDMSSELRKRSCQMSLQAIVDHYAGMLDTWLAKPEAPLSIHRAFRDLTAEHQKAFAAARELATVPLADIKTEGDAQQAVKALRKTYLEKKKVLAALADLDRAFLLSLDSIETGLLDHTQNLTTLRSQCEMIAAKIDQTSKHMESWRYELRRMKAYVGVAQDKRFRLLETAYATNEGRIRDRAKAALNKDLMELDRLLRQALAASELQGEFEEWFYAETARIAREIHTYKQFHEPQAALVAALMRAKEFQAKAQSLPPLGAGVNEHLIARTNLAVSEFTRMLDELRLKKWTDFLSEQTTQVRAAGALDKTCQDYAASFLELAADASRDEGRAAAKTFALFKRVCKGGV